MLQVKLKVFSLYRGWKIALSSLPAMQNPSKIDLSSFFTRMVRYVKNYMLFVKRQLTEYNCLTFLNFVLLGCSYIFMILLSNYAEFW